MRVSIELQYRDKVFTSDVTEETEISVEKLNHKIQEVSRGEYEFFTIKCKGKKIFFTEAVLKESIIIITRHPDETK
jgi:hypothetical protein